MSRLRFYLDSCCYNRPFDDQSQLRIYYESWAVFTLILRGWFGFCDLIGSDILLLELRHRLLPLMLYSNVREVVPYDEAIRRRAEQIRNATNIKTMDSLHLASAEAGKADIFLTTDDRLIKASAKISLSCWVTSPLTYFFLEGMSDHVR